MAFTLVQSNLENSGTASSITLAFGAQPGAGNLLVCYVCSTTTSVSLSVTDSVNGSYNTDVLNTTGTANGIWTFPNASGSGGAPTVTLHGSFSSNLYMILEEWSGAATTAPLDQTGVNDGLSVGTSTVSTSSATTQANELSLVSLGTVGSRTITPTNGYT